MTLSVNQLTVGQQCKVVLVEDLTRTQIVQYAGASGDFNPLHTDEVFATEVAGYSSTFGHGMLTMALAGRMVTDFVGDGNLLKFGVRFRKPVWPGDRLRGTMTVDEVNVRSATATATVSLSVVNERDELVISGSATARIDR